MYLWVKALHVTAVIVWMAGMVVTPLLIAWLGHPAEGETDETSRGRRTALSIVRRHYLVLATPAMLITWALGLWMAVEAGWMRYPWLIGKLALVVGLSALHGVLSGQLRRLTTDVAHVAPSWMRYGTVVLVIFIAIISVLVILKPGL